MEDKTLYQVTKDTIIYDIMLNAPVTRPLFERIGMHCLGCAYATGESVEQACNAHGVELEPFLQEINDCIAANS